MLTPLQTEETSMHNEPLRKPEDPRQAPRNKGGSKPPLRTEDVWSIRTKLQVQKRTRDLAMFNLAIDSKLRGCDVVSLKVEDAAPHGMMVDRVTVRQRKTRRPVRFELSEQTRQAVDDYIRSAPRRAGEFLFPNGRHTDRCLKTRQYSRLVSAWIAGIDLASFCR
jgi:integrase